MKRKLLFSITKKDFEIQTFCSGGKGGQNQNKTESGVRLIHKASGARGEARDNRNQHINKKNAFRRLIATKTFQNWLKIEISKRTEEQDKIEKQAQLWVDEQMKEKNLLVEYL